MLKRPLDSQNHIKNCLEWKMLVNKVMKGGVWLLIEINKMRTRKVATCFKNNIRCVTLLYK